jgi:tetratricopeptide (TPR) repeat protein
VPREFNPVSCRSVQLPSRRRSGRSFPLVTRHPEDDHVANQVQYLRESRCFQKSPDLTCINCHNPHHDSSTTGTGESRQATCLKCHQPGSCLEHDRLPVAVQTNCVGCHMPRRNKIQVNFQTASDAYVPPAQRYEHRIAVYPEARDEVLLKWHLSQSDAVSRSEAERLKRSLAEYWLEQASRRQGAFRFLAAIDACREARRFDSSLAINEKLRDLAAINTRLDNDWFKASSLSQTGQTAAAAEILRQTLDVKPDSARVHGKLGTLYAILGQSGFAVKHLRAVTDCDPDDPYGEAMLGWLDYLNGKPESALVHYHEAVEREPYRARLRYEIGLALEQVGRRDEAIAAYRLALEIDPRHADTCQSLSEARRQADPAEALQLARRAVALTQSRNPRMLLTLADVYADADRFSEAEEALDAALSQVSPGDEPLGDEIRMRRQKFRSRARESESR